MTSLRQKRIKGHSYYYLVEMARVNGKPKTVWQLYLGNAKKMKEFYTKGEEVAKVHSKIFGSVASMLSIADELRFEDIIKEIITDNNYKLAIWQHMLLQSICRFHGPISKKGSIKWYKDSILPLLWKKDFSSPQTIMNQFDKLVDASKNRIPQLEEGLCKALLSKGIKPSVLVWDPTNFFTYIEKGGDLPRKGASKEKRYDKNIINLGLVVSEENIPLMHTVYEGNKREIKVVTEVVDSIHARFQKLGENAEALVFVFDRGNNSKTNVEHIGDKFHFIGALKKNQLKHLFDIEFAKFKDLYKNQKGNLVKGYRTTEAIYDKDYTIVVTYNEKTYEKQKKKTSESIKKIKEKFSTLEKSINNKKRGKKATTKGVAGRVSDFLHKQYKSLFSWNLDEKQQKFTWSINDLLLKQREKTYGKTILFTDLEEWETENIAKTYNSKSIVEDDFKVLKDKLVIPVKPILCRKDHRVRVTIFTCVVAMIFYRYMLWKLRHLKMTDERINEELKGMRLAFITQKGHTAVKKVLEHMSKEQIEIYSSLNLKRYLPS